MTLDEAKIVIEMRTKQFSKQAENEEAYPIEKAFNHGVVDGLNIAMDAIEHIDTEPVGNTDKLTLEELAHELRKIFDFRWLTMDPYADEITLWMDKPAWEGDSWWAGDSSYLLDFYSNRLEVPLDLSEYKDEQGNIDYSKCIVEVE